MRAPLSLTGRTSSLSRDWPQGLSAEFGGTYAAMPELYLKARELFYGGKLEEARQVPKRVLPNHL